MAIDIVSRGLAKAAKDKTDKITVTNNINLDTVTSDINDMTNQGTITKRERITQTNYDALVTAGTVVATTEYLIVEVV